MQNILNVSEFTQAPCVQSFVYALLEIHCHLRLLPDMTARIFSVSFYRILKEQGIFVKKVEADYPKEAKPNYEGKKVFQILWDILKGKSTLMIYDRHPELQSKWDKAFWARGYYVETIGNITEEDRSKVYKRASRRIRKEIRVVPLYSGCQQ